VYNFEKSRQRKRFLSHKAIHLYALIIPLGIAAYFFLSQEEWRDQLFSQSPAPEFSNVFVIDGDTIEINGERIRLYGIDAPEQGQPCRKNNESYNCGKASKEHLKFLITGTKVSCDDRGKDRYGRIIAVCKADSQDIGQLMVKHGWAIAYRKYSSDYIKDEKFARKNKLGMWAKDFILPSEWRALRRN
jgi:endonuclease YncB( thermonuclease family)